MTHNEFTDEALADLFAAPADFDDSQRFEDRVTRGLQIKLWMRQWLVVLAGFVGGLYALAQIIRMPASNITAAQSLHKAALDTDHTLRAGFEAVDVAGRNVAGLADQWGHTLMFMQTPTFFWVSFSLCLMFLGLYYAYSQEETL